MAELTEYTWVFVLAIIFSFIGAFGIGANDVANAFATSVGAKSITVKQAVIIATIFEFGGAFFMGSHVAKTIRKGITDIDLFQEDPNDAEVLMFGMMCVTFSVAAWLLLATYLSLPVSTTHTCVGSIMGIAIAAKGWNGVVWDVVGKIILSWFFSPILSGVAAVCIYLFIRTFIMSSPNPRDRTLIFYPFLVAFCVIIVVFYTIYKGTKRLGLKDTNLGTASLISFSSGIVCAGITWFLIVPPLTRRLDSYTPEEEDNKDLDSGSGDVIPEQAIEMGMSGKGNADQGLSTQSTWTEINIAMDTVIPDVEARFQDAASDQVLAMLAKAERHDPHAELAFSYLQVFSACFDAFAHGANDVANSIGPMAAVYGIWDSGIVEKKVDMPLWILGMGGVGIVLGLILYGYNIMQAIGFELTKLSPSRGFSIELGAALVVLTGSRLEIPLSTTHCQVGATVGVGLTEGFGNVNWWLFGRVVFGWVVTLLVASLMSAAIFSYAVYAPQN
jgi:sodium-dependent phosphate transporter